MLLNWIIIIIYLHVYIYTCIWHCTSVIHNRWFAVFTGSEVDWVEGFCLLDHLVSLWTNSCVSETTVVSGPTLCLRDYCSLLSNSVSQRLLQSLDQLCVSETTAVSWATLCLRDYCSLWTNTVSQRLLQSLDQSSLWDTELLKRLQ